MRHLVQPHQPADLLAGVRPLHGAHRLDRAQTRRPHPPQIRPGAEVGGHLDSDAKGEGSFTVSLNFL